MNKPIFFMMIGSVATIAAMEYQKNGNLKNITDKLPKMNK